MDSNDLLVKLIVLSAIFYLLLPYMNAIVFSIVFATILFPFYKPFHNSSKNRIIAGLLVFLFFLSLIVGSAAILSKLAVDIYTSIPQEFLQNANLMPQDIWNNLYASIQRADIRDILAILGKIPGFAISFALMIFLTYYLLVDHDRIERWFLKVFKQKEIYERMVDNIRAVVLGFLVAYTLQFITYFLFLIYAGIGNAFLIAFSAVLFAILPLLGAWMVMVYPAYILYTTGKVLLAVIALLLPFLWMLFDNFVIKPRYSGHLHPALLLLAMFSGMHFFGIAGILSGPVLLTFLLTILSVEGG